MGNSTSKAKIYAESQLIAEKESNSPKKTTEQNPQDCENTKPTSMIITKQQSEFQEYMQFMIKQKQNQKNKKQSIDTKQIDTEQIDTKQFDTKQIDTEQIETKQIKTKQINTKQIDTKQIDLSKSSTDFNQLSN